MSEFIGVEASVKIVPDTTQFRKELVAQVAAATATPVPVPVTGATAQVATQRQQQAVANARAESAASALATANKALIVSEERLAAVSHAGSTATTELGIAKAKLAASNEAVAASERAVTAALRTDDAALKVATIDTLGYAVAQQRAALASAEAAAATTKSAIAHEQLARGAGSNLLTLLGLRGATLAASGGFLAGAAAIGILRKSVSGAIEDQENLFRITRILGDELGKGSQKWSEGLANSFALSDDQALKFQSTIANVLHNVGLTDERIAPLSKRLVELGADMAAFSHVDADVTLRALTLAVTGNLRAIRPFVGGIRQADITLRAFQQTGKDSVKDLTSLERENALLSIVFERTANQTGAAAARSGDLAQQAKILSANLNNLGDRLGHVIIPFLRGAAQDANSLVTSFQKLIDLSGRIPGGGEGQDIFSKIIGKAHDIGIVGSQFGPLGTQIKLIQFGVDQFTDSESKSTDQAREFGAVMHGLAGEFFGAASSLDALAAKIRALDFTAAENKIAAFSEHLLDLQFFGAGSAAQIATLRRAVGAAQEAIGAAVTVEGRRQARQQRNQLQGQIDQIIASDKAAADAAANKARAAAAKAKADAERAAREAQAALDAQDQALLTNQQFAQTDLQIAAVKAQHTKSLIDDLAVQRRQLALTEQQIIEARKIHDATLRRQTIQQLTLDAEQTRLNIQQTKEQQLQNIRQRKVDAAEAAVQSAQLDAELADTLKKPKAQIAALQRENKALEQERKLWVGNTLKQKEIRNQIAANNATIKELRKATAERNDGLRALEFEFLQSVSGFAGTLLSNLLPTSSVAGTVGGGAITTPTGDIVGPAGFATAAHQRPGQDLSAAVQAKAAGRGATQSQMSALISIQRQQLNVLLRLTGQRTHPEATHQRTWQATEMLNTGW